MKIFVRNIVITRPVFKNKRNLCRTRLVLSLTTIHLNDFANNFFYRYLEQTCFHVHFSMIFIKIAILKKYVHDAVAPLYQRTRPWCLWWKVLYNISQHLLLRQLRLNNKLSGSNGKKHTKIMFFLCKIYKLWK